MNMKEPNENTAICRECGGELAFHGYKHVERVGAWKLEDPSCMAWQCRTCGTAQLSLDDLHAYELTAAKTALLDGKHEGAVLKYARKALGFTQKELATFLGYAHETVSRWENGHEAIQHAAVMAIIGVLCRALAGEAAEDVLAESKSIQSAAPTPPEGIIRVRRVAGR